MSIVHGPTTEHSTRRRSRSHTRARLKESLTWLVTGLALWGRFVGMAGLMTRADLTLARRIRRTRPSRQWRTRCLLNWLSELI